MFRARYGVVVLSVALGLLGWATIRSLTGNWLPMLEDRSGDLVWRMGAERKDERRLILVDINEQSLREIGPWPWPRATQARLIEQLARAGARQQILDIVLADARPDDAILEQVLQQHQSVLAQIFALDPGTGPSSGKPAGALDWTACPSLFPLATGYLATVPTLAGRLVGHITPRVATDGVVRLQPAVICSDNGAYPALSLVALMNGTGETGLVLQRGAGPLDAPWMLSGRSQAFPAIPLDENGDIRIPWRLHPHSFISLSAADVLADRVPAGLLNGAWVLVGSSAFGLHDVIATPFEGAAAGLQVHAEIITAMIDGRMPATPSGAPAYRFIMAVLGIALLMFMARERRRFPVYLVPLAAAAWGLVLWGIHGLSQIKASIWLGWADPALFVGLSGVTMGILEHARSRVDRDRLYTHLSSYLPAPVAEALAQQSPSSAIRASTRQVSVMFADIRNFSAYCEARPPEEAAAVLHAFFSTAARVIKAHGGVIESFQGDAVFAVWNSDGKAEQQTTQSMNLDAPEHSFEPESDPISVWGVAPEPQVPERTGRPSHAQLALNAAISLQQAIQGVLPDPAPAGLEPLALGIGVETGPAMSGSFGLASRRTHMVMGRTVTIASRLVGMTADLAHPILVGEGLAAQVGGIGLKSMGVFLLDGLRVPHHVYAPPISAAPTVQ
ncbi:adenylate/guanylate cyclase domain-containing protein [Candidatus Skiveiella danica]|jgi:adenylate cyclase|uniref:adenylate/guanylate cyclase domain-containing protein n=1 Tax=Candidatus Skiveiella danica TaxID=3386177 RepID=UPI0009D2B42C|nr:MAG: Adenylate cyclase 1 [Alphaproteobacteria bacterium ADurb.Bin100]